MVPPFPVAACWCVLTKDRETLLAFFDFPAEHWDHLRTSNPIENVFATVRHRTVRTKGALSAKTAKLMVFKLVNAAAKTWRRLKGENQLPKVVQGVKFKNGIEVPKCRLTTPPDQPRHPKYCLARGIRRVGSAKLDQAVVWNVRTWPAMPREKAHAATTARPKVPMRRRGADYLVVVMKRV